jgi:hypothetical protein
VSLDWRTPLSEEKSHTFLHTTRQLEDSYAMFSINLDEAFGMRRAGRLSTAYQLLHVAPDLCGRLTRPLLNLLRAMLEHARHFGTMPNLAPLNPEDFHSVRGQRAALLNDLFSRVLLSRRARFLHKINVLTELVGHLSESFGAASEHLAEEQFFRPDREWDRLDAVHYDLNTCLREAAVLLKCFLHALPASQLPAFAEGLRHSSAPSSSLVAARPRYLAHRRMAFLKGQ